MISSSTRVSTLHLYLALSLILLVSIFIALANGAVNLALTDLKDQHQLIFFELRLPRVLLAALVGANLALCGAISQGLFRNALADPSLIGVTAGASLGASLVIVGFLGFNVLDKQWLSLPLVSFGAFIGGLVTVVLVYQLAMKINSGSVLTMLLVGIAITAFVSALTGLLDFYADSEQLRRMSLWRMGGLHGANYASVLLAAAILILLLCVLPFFAAPLNAMLLGESEARHLGIDIDKLKLHLIAVLALGTGAAVALAGTIAFVGLIVPHLLRLLVGPNHRVLLPASAFGGAILLSLADTFSRTLVAPTELPVGLLTALLGAPFFIFLLRKNYGR